MVYGARLFHAIRLLVELVYISHQINPSRTLRIPQEGRSAFFAIAICDGESFTVLRPDFVLRDAEEPAGAT